MRIINKWMEAFMGEQLGGPYILTMQNLLFSILFTIVAASFMLVIYRVCHDTLTYNRKCNITLMMLALLSTVLLALIQNNPFLSLGVLGSLSICRIRTNTRDPRDIGFIFWSMAIGIASATQSYLIGCVGSIVLAGVMIFTKHRGEDIWHLLLVVRGSNTDLDRIQEIVDSSTRSNLVKAKNILSDSFELVYEVEIPEKNGNRVIENIFELGGIDSVNLLAQNA